MQTNEELHSFPENVRYFHDCCIAEMHDVSGACCTGRWELQATLHR